MSVDFPDPFGPISPMRPPSEMVNGIFLKSGVAPNRFDSPCAVMIGGKWSCFLHFHFTRAAASAIWPEDFGKSSCGIIESSPSGAGYYSCISHCNPTSFRATVAFDMCDRTEDTRKEGRKTGRTRPPTSQFLIVSPGRVISCLNPCLSIKVDSLIVSRLTLAPADSSPLFPHKIPDSCASSTNFQP